MPQPRYLRQRLSATPRGIWCNSAIIALLEIAYIPTDIRLFPRHRWNCHLPSQGWRGRSRTSCPSLHSGFLPIRTAGDGLHSGRKTGKRLMCNFRLKTMVWRKKTKAAECCLWDQKIERPTASLSCSSAAVPASELPLRSSSGDQTQMDMSPGITAMMPPPTPLLPGIPTR